MSTMPPVGPEGPGPVSPAGVGTMLALDAALEGQRLCALGYHAWTPWTPPEEHGVSLTWCARSCGMFWRSDHGR